MNPQYPAIPVGQPAVAQPVIHNSPVEVVQEAIPVNQSNYIPPPAMTQQQNIAMVPIAHNPEVITEEGMRAALTDLVKSKIFWGKGAVKQMTISNIQTFSSYYCIWETFMESRKTKYKERPFKGEMIDGPENGYPPQPWDIPVNYPELFHETKEKVRVPHTESVVSCNKCAGRGRVQCDHCRGVGRVQCNRCHGRGSVHVENGDSRCDHCNGDGKVRCMTCHADGMVRCKHCDGNGRVVRYLQLTVKFINHRSEEFCDQSGLPDDVIRKSVSTIICNQTDFHIYPPQDVFVPEVRNACTILFNKAEELIRANRERLLQQRVRVYITPVAKAVGTWKNKNCDFWVHGNNKVAYAPRYSKEFYHGCSIV